MQVLRQSTAGSCAVYWFAFIDRVLRDVHKERERSPAFYFFSPEPPAMSGVYLMRKSRVELDCGDKIKH